jgi:hypothetical protein
VLQHSTLLSDLDLVHAFTTRRGGVSRGSYASLNLGGKWGDEPAAVSENHRRVAEAAGYAREHLRTAKQVHGDTVLHAGELDADAEADALWVRRSDALVVAVLTADCVPVLLADRGATVACAVHSGWRGTVAGIVVTAVRTLVERSGVAASDLVAAIGPCIELDAFEVGPEVAHRFDPAFVDARDPRPHVDLVAACRAQLLSAGLASDSIERVGGCTHADDDLYFSYRRDGAGTGQMMSLVGFAG